MVSFKKATRPIAGFFRKLSDAPRAFKKGAQEVASGFGSAARVIGQGARIGNQVLGAVEKAPFGGVLSPAIGAARAGLNVLSLAGSAAKAGKEISRDIAAGRSAKAITSNTLERASALKDEAKGIKFA